MLTPYFYSHLGRGATFAQADRMATRAIFERRRWRHPATGQPTPSPVMAIS